jgi:hypothetical protein
MAERKHDPIADYVEWTNNRYNPGHYLGGNVPAHARNLSSPGLGRAMLLNALLALGVSLAFIGWTRENGLVTVAGVVIVAAWVAGAALVRRAGAVRRHRNQP